jgi:hypothetical protein
MIKKKRVILGIGYPTFFDNRVGVRTGGYELPLISRYDPKLFWCYCTGKCECPKWKLILERQDDKKRK